VLSIIESEGLCERARVAGARVLAELKGVQSANIVDVRGIGLMIGVQLKDDVVAERVQMECMKNGVLIMVCGAEENVVRLVPSLNITDEELAHGMQVFTAALTA
jgi:4-aminobutyrate aminotransferase-like enzyme